MRVFDAEAVHAALPYAPLIEGLIEHHRRDVDARDKATLEQPSASGEGSDMFLALPAWQSGRAIGAKLVSVFPANEKNGSGLPSVQGVYVLFSGVDGSVQSVIEGASFTLRKTAADSGVGARFLARQDSERMLMVGAGALGPHLIQAHIAARPSIREVHVWNRTRARAEALVANLSLEGVELTVCDDLEGSARQADVISCATMATEPLILGEWLKPGAHLDLVGSFLPDMHECDEAAVRRASVFTDSPWSALEDCGEMLSALASGALTREDVLANLFDFARGKHAGRDSADQITLFKNGGGGHLDLMVAQILNENQTP